MGNCNFHFLLSFSFSFYIFIDWTFQKKDDQNDLKETIKDFVETIRNSECVRSFVECRKKHGILGKVYCDAKLPVCILTQFQCEIHDFPLAPLLAVGCIGALLINPMDPRIIKECIWGALCKWEKYTVCRLLPHFKEQCMKKQ